MDISIKEGRFLVEYARNTLDSHFGKGKMDVPAEMQGILEEKQGIYVNIKRMANNQLRGCSGYSEGILPLKDALCEAMLSAALRDPRFPPLKKNELNSINIEISILSPAQRIDNLDTNDYTSQIKIGRDGVIVEKNSLKGVMLPQSAVERRWNIREFLSHASMSAGLQPDAWRTKDAKIYRFTAEIFTEKEPNGLIIKRTLKLEP